MNGGTVAHAALISCAACFVMGCGPTERVRQAVGGIIRVNDGAELATVSGQIRFFPTDGNAGPAVSTSVVDGRYQFSVANGPPPGTYRVQFLTTNEPATTAEPADTPQSKGDLLTRPSAPPIVGSSTAMGTATTYETRLEISDIQASDLDIAFSSEMRKG
ncbi:hypothetical protein [Rubripirellula tenax]|uniref:hypothetical protein n=1 Tax=Rubripirellula tenax TaxID=2528015 RepID=UPI0011B407DB|nr:hypothetical protein [Rubripirellula tenax]